MRREVFFHEDDFCQQQLLPSRAQSFVEQELLKLNDFADAHRAPDGTGWTDVYVRGEPSADIGELKITRDDIHSLISAVLPPFESVFTGSSSHREPCRCTAAWGSSPECALFASWSNDGVISSVWSEFFLDDESAFTSASKAVGTLGKRYSLLYVDWSWGYVCDAADERTFAAKLREKLKAITQRLN